MGTNAVYNKLHESLETNAVHWGLQETVGTNAVHWGLHETVEINALYWGLHETVERKTPNSWGKKWKYSNTLLITAHEQIDMNFLSVNNKNCQLFNVDL